jgi:tetratricopeptide (TPR) repeat protein
MAKSPYYVENKPLTRADELRAQLDKLEAQIGRLGYGLGQEALTIPALFDAVTASLASFQAGGQHLRAEEARLETVSARFSRKASVFLREVGGAAVLREARSARKPDPAHWWWYADRLVADRRRDGMRRMVRMVAGMLVVLLLLFLLYQKFLAPDPATRERLTHQHSAEDLVLQGDVAGALGEVEQALAIAPDDPDLLVFLGALQQELGQNEAAEETFAAAELAFGDREDFLLTRARTNLMLGQPTAALADAQEVVELNPESAEGYMTLARAHEQSEEFVEAIFAYEQATYLAEEQGNYQLSAMARINVGLLRQRLPALPAGGN